MFLLYCNAGRRNYGTDDTKLPPVRHAWEFLIVLRGNCIRVNRVQNTDREERVAGPLICVSGPANAHGWSGKPKDYCTVFCFLFDEVDSSLRQVVEQTGYRMARFPVESIPHLRALYNRCLKAKKSRDFSSSTIYHIVSLELTIFFLSLLPALERPQTSDFAQNKVIEALAWYKANLQHGPNINEAAEAVHLSSTHLRRLFHKANGTSPQEAFTQIQFERAKELMLDQLLTLELIAEKSGFGSASAFSRAFKLEFGVSPKSYRANLREELMPGVPANRSGTKWALISSRP